ncbi:MAG TPA: DUF192 domain-containing protein [Gaiellaceae bacterium]|nr:DUF192 domain-containing protein [Gaiellaceae bacterium]
MRVAELRTAEGRVVCARCLLATNPLTRARGLLGRSGLAPDEGMYFRPAGSIHMFFMRFAIDAVFCDGDLRVLGVERELKPWRMARRKGAKVVIELPVGGAAGLEDGDRLELIRNGG